MTITNSQQDTARQTIRNTHIRVDLLNFQFQVVDSLEGNAVEGSISIDATADIRRTCNVGLVVTDASFTPQSGGKIWLDKYVQIYVGVDDIKTGEISWTNMGIYLINAPTYNYDAATKTLSFQGLDLMAKLTGARNGYLTGDDYEIPQGSNVRSSIVAILDANGFYKYVVSECLNIDGEIQTVPYKMEFDMGATWYDMLVKLRDILPNYQIYFDVDGVFHYETMPFSEYDPIEITDDIWKENVLSEQINVDFESVKNVIEVYGATHDLEYYASAITVTSSSSQLRLNLTVSNYSSLINGMNVGFTLENSQNYSGGITVRLSSSGSGSWSNTYHIVDENGNNINFLPKGTWIISFQTNSWVFLGSIQAQAIVKDTDLNSPFYIGNPAGEIRIVLFGGEYEDIQSDYLAQQRAYFELYTRCRLNDSLNLSCVPIYWIDVNLRVSYTPLGEDTTNTYIIQTANIDLSPSGTMELNLSKFYNYYPLQ